VVTGNLSPLLLAGMFYLIITVPLTHVVNHIDNRLRLGKQKPGGVVSGLVEVGELKDTAGKASSEAARPAIKAGSLEVRDLDMAYGELQVLRKIRLKVEPGTVT
ncbi:amino acid ABC transporter ATP-binding protein, partial [Mesorhizobium sp. M4B.F.Ca.ET.150.01.1.1]